MHNSTTEVVYKFIQDYIHQEGIAPSIREIAEGCYLGRSTVQRHLDRLASWGWIIQRPGRARGIVVVKRPDESDRQNSTS
jgi:SOS-response transcriptional repressor LexA